MRRYLSSILLLMIFIGFAKEGRAWLKLPDKYAPRKVAKVERAEPGYARWSPDGLRIAFIKRGVNIYDVKSGKKRRVRLDDPYFVNWSSGEEVLALFKEGDEYKLARIDAETLEVQKTALPRRADAVFPSPEGDGLLVFSSTARRVAIGTEVSFGLLRYDPGKRKLKEVYLWSGTMFGKYDLHALSGWVLAGLGPFDTGAVLIEYRDPPALLPYLKLRSVDYVDGSVREVGRIDDALLRGPGSRSPDGSRIALTDLEGRLHIVEPDGSLTAVGGDARGLYPAWNPMGSQIFLGGTVVDSNGENPEVIIPDRPEGVALWSPDGNRMALMAGKTLWLLEGFEPCFVSPDKGVDEETASKGRLLRELLSEGLISRQEYQERMMKLLGREQGEWR